MFYYLRRFAASFEQLRINHRRAKNARNSASLLQFEKQLFSWPEKQVVPVTACSHVVPPESDHVDPPEDENDRCQEQRRVTMTGRPTGKLNITEQC